MNVEEGSEGGGARGRERQQRVGGGEGGDVFQRGETFSGSFHARLDNYQRRIRERHASLRRRIDRNDAFGRD